MKCRQSCLLWAGLDGLKASGKRRLKWQATYLFKLTFQLKEI